MSDTSIKEEDRLFNELSKNYSQKDKVIYDFSQINDAISEFYLLKE